MPRIPDGRDVERLTPVSDRAITSVSQQPFVARMGQEIQQNYNVRAREDERLAEEDRRTKTRLQLAKAKSTWLRERTNASAALEQDQDYATHTERYNARLGEAQPGIADSIEDLEARALFEEQMEADTIIGSDSVRRQAFTIETQVELASMGELLASNKDAYMRGDQITRAELVQASSDLIEASQERGYVNPVQAQQLREKTVNDYLTSRLEGMEPRDQIDFLNSDPQAEMLPVDVRQKIEKVAKSNLVLDDALGHVDELIGEFGDDRGSVMDGISKIDDPKVRTQARAQATARLSQMKMAESEDQAQAYDGFLQQMISGRSLSDLRKEQPDAWLNMGGTKQAALIKAANSGAKTVKTDLSHYAKVNKLWREDGVDAAREHLWKNAQLFSPADFRKFDDKLNTASMKDEDEGLDSIFSITKRIENFALDRGVDENSIGELERSFDLNRQRFQVDNGGREPNLAEERQLLDDLLIEYDNPFYRLDLPDDAVQFELKLEEQGILQVHFDLWEEKHGKPPTAEEKHRIRNAAHKLGKL